MLLLMLQPVNTTRVNAAEIMSRVAVLQSVNKDNPNKAGFFEEFEVSIKDCFGVFWFRIICQIFFC